MVVTIVASYEGRHGFIRAPGLQLVVGCLVRLTLPTLEYSLDLVGKLLLAHEALVVGSSSLYHALVVQPIGPQFLGTKFGNVRCFDLIVANIISKNGIIGVVDIIPQVGPPLFVQRTKHFVLPAQATRASFQTVIKQTLLNVNNVLVFAG
jgi:hypothetical protein